MNKTKRFIVASMTAMAAIAAAQAQTPGGSPRLRLGLPPLRRAPRLRLPSPKIGRPIALLQVHKRKRVVRVNYFPVSRTGRRFGVGGGS